MKRKSKQAKERNVKRRKEELIIGNSCLNLCWRKKQGNSSYCAPFATWHLIQLYLFENSVAIHHKKQVFDIRDNFSRFTSPLLLVEMLKTHPSYEKVNSRGFKIVDMAHLLFCCGQRQFQNTAICYLDRSERLKRAVSNLLERKIPFVFSYQRHAYTAILLCNEPDFVIVLDSRCALGINKFNVSTIEKFAARIMWFESRKHPFATIFAAPNRHFLAD